MKKTNLPILLVAIMACFACSSQEDQKKLSLDNIPVLNVEVPQRLYYLDISAFMDSTTIEIIPLQTDHPLSMLNYADYLYVLKDHFLIADQKQARISLFRLDGTFERLIGHQGRGPEEFNDVSNILYNTYHDKVEIYDSKSRFTRYEVPTSKFVDSRERMTNDFYNFRFFPAGPGAYVLYNPLYRSAEGEDMQYRLAYMKNNKILWKKFKYSSSEAELMYIQSKSAFWYFKDTLGFFEPFIPVLYNVNENGVQPRLYFDFGDGNNPPYDTDQVGPYVSENEPIKARVRLNSVMESDHYLFVCLRIVDGFQSNLILRKTEEGYQQVALGAGFNHSMGMMISLHTIQDNRAYGTVRASSVVNTQKQLKIKDPNTLTPFEHHLLSLKVADTDNDLIISFLLK
jgi:hypothetical protein